MSTNVLYLFRSALSECYNLSLRCLRQPYITFVQIKCQLEKNKKIPSYNKFNTNRKKSAPSVSYISSTDKVSINLPHQKIGSPVLLNIYTLSGILVFSYDINQGNCTVSLSSVPAGTYIADIEMSTEHYSLKFTKE